MIVRKAVLLNFFVDFEFKSLILQGLIGLVFNDAMHRIVRAFETRADALYGQNLTQN
jgi:coenzyme Q-binding protein COQ10